MQIPLESERFPDEIVMTFHSITLESEQSPNFRWNALRFWQDFALKPEDFQIKPHCRTNQN